MGSFVIAMTLGVACLPAWNDDLRAGSHQISETAEAFRRLSAEFESAQRFAIALANKAKTEAERKKADGAMPDRRKYAQRFLDLASRTNDEASVVDALVWVVRHASGTPEGDDAVHQIANLHLRSDRIASVCHSLGAQGMVRESLLKRIFDENPNRGIRGRASLALAFARSLQLRKEIRTAGNLPKNRPDRVESRQLVVQKQKSRTIALAAEIEHWLRLVLDEFPGVVLDQDIMENFGFGAENLGPAAGQMMRRIAETHPQPATRSDAECGLALQQMEIASLVADLRPVAALPPESKQCAGPGLAAACVFGGEARLKAIDSKALVHEIEQRLQRISDRVQEVENPGSCYFHLIMDSPTLSRYHAGTETLLRSAAKSHPSWRFRAAARRSLAIYLAGIADLSRTIDSDRARWVDRLGEDRVEQIRRLDWDRLMHESSALAEEISKENQAAGRIPDAKIEELRKAYAHRHSEPDRRDRAVQPRK
jgi:hypothetical protein